MNTNKRLENIVSGLSYSLLSTLFNQFLLVATELNEDELIKWAKLELNGYFSSNPALEDEDKVPPYRTIVGQYFDTFNRPVVIDDPELQFIFEYRLREPIIELEKLSAGDGNLSLSNPNKNKLFQEYFNIEVRNFVFSRATIHGVLAGIRSTLMEKVFELKSKLNKKDNNNQLFITESRGKSMLKKLQVFISSTYTDLIEERQAAVQAVLKAGHIPAGMELFKTGDKSQKETIKRWIDESDAYILILGGRYGSMDRDTGKSYTHWEYDYAGEVGKARVAIVLSEVAIEHKVKSLGHKNAVEQENPQLLREFKNGLMNEKLVSIVDDNKDIEREILLSLKEYESREDLFGWVSGREVIELQNEIQRLRSISSHIEENKANSRKPKWFYDLKNILENLHFDEAEDELLPKNMNLLREFILYGEKLRGGIKLSEASEKRNNIFKHIYFNLVPIYDQYGLIIKTFENVDYISKLSDRGRKFLQLLEEDDE